MRIRRFLRIAVAGFAACLLGVGAQEALAQSAPMSGTPTTCLTLPMTRVGSATLLGNGQYEVTPAAASRSGALWGTSTINLSQPFDYSAWIYMGLTSSPYGGGDGMTFTLQTTGSSALGNSGRGIGSGYGWNGLGGSASIISAGITPSFVVEFDTYHNGDAGWSDPSTDHLAMYRNGDGRHTTTSNIATPHVFSTTLKDGLYHLFRFTWDPATNNVRVYLDNVLVQSVTHNVRTGFTGTQVYWGFTASTGGAYNSHRVCHLNAPTTPLPTADYGDAPDSYGQVWHLRPAGQDGLYLGETQPTTEIGPRFHATAQLDEYDDVFISGESTPPEWSGGNISLYGRGAGGYLSAWVDWNRDGRFDAAERVIADVQNNGPLDLVQTADDIMQVYVAPRPDLMTGGEGLSFIRLRWSTQAGLGPTGEAPNGEVQDHPINLVRPRALVCAGSTLPSNFATSGAGLYKDSIFWLDWSCGATTQFNAGDTITKLWTLPSGHRLQARIDNLTASMTPYNTGAYGGDGLPQIYGGVNPIGLRSRYLSGSANSPYVSFSLNLELQTAGGVALPYALTTVAADAEDLNSANEALILTTNGASWRLIDAYNSLSAVFSNAARTARLYDLANVFSTLVLASEGGSKIDATIDPGGMGAAAFGVFVASDYGDAPATYGAAGHVQTIVFTGGSQPVAATLLGLADRATRSFAAALRLGAAVDTEPTPLHSPLADGDDLSFDDEDGATYAPARPDGNPEFIVGQSVTATISVTGPGYLRAWVDWNRNGVFDAAELVVNDLRDNLAGDLNPTAGIISVAIPTPASVATAGQSFIRLRWSAAAGVGPTEHVLFGETEDQIAYMTPVAQITGRVYEDKNYGGGAGRAFADAAGAVGVPSAYVELYNASGVFVSRVATDANGAYAFSVPPAVYYVRPVSSSVRSQRGGGAAVIGVQTFRRETDPGASPALRVVTNEIGGRAPATADAPANPMGATPAALETAAFTLSHADWGGAAAPVHSVSRIVLPAAGLGNVDFGYNFSAIVNRNDAGQGSLRQFVTNVLGMGGRAALDQAANALFDPPAGTETTIFQIPAGGARAVISLASDLPTITIPNIRFNGYTQAGATPGPLGARVLNVELRAPAGVSAIKLGPAADDTVVAGFLFNGGTALSMQGGAGYAARTHVKGNAFGVAPQTNSADAPSTVIVRQARDWTIGVLEDGGSAYANDGMADSAESNLFGGHPQQSILLESVAGSVFRVSGNAFGYSPNMINALADRSGSGATHLSVVDAQNLLIGGTSALTRNHFLGGVAAAVTYAQSAGGAQSMTILGNRFGAYGYATGGAMFPALPVLEAIRVNGASGLTLNVGDGTSAGRNLFNATDSGLRLLNSNIQSALIRGNWFGLDASGGHVFNHASAGALRVEGAAGDVTFRENLAAFGAGSGVVVAQSGGVSGQRVLVERNSFYGNAGLAIDLDDDLVTLNDANDLDAGPNGLLNFPMIRGIRLGPVNALFEGCAPTGSIIEAYEYDDSASSPSGGGPPSNSFGHHGSYGEGWRFMFARQEGGGADQSSAACVLTDDPDGNSAQGMSAFSFLIPIGDLGGLGEVSRVTFTASLNHATSEFSPAYAVGGFVDLELSKTIDLVTPLLGFPVEFGVNLSSALGAAPHVTVRDLLPTGYILNSFDVAPQSAYDPDSGIWEVQNLAETETRSLVIRATPVAVNLWTNTAEIEAATEANGDPLMDVDSTPGNGVTTEDDYAWVAPTPVRGTGTPPSAAVCAAGTANLDMSGLVWPLGGGSISRPFGALTAHMSLAHPTGGASFSGSAGAASGPGGAPALAISADRQTHLVIQFPRPVEGLRLELRGLGGDANDLERARIVGFWDGFNASAQIFGGASVSVATTTVFSSPGVSQHEAAAVGVFASSASGDEGAMILGFERMVDRIVIDLSMISRDPATAPAFSVMLTSLTGCALDVAGGLRLTPDHESTVPAGQLAIYRHEAVLGEALAGGLLDFLTTSDQGLDWAIHLDAVDPLTGAPDGVFGAGIRWFRRARSFPRPAPGPSDSGSSPRSRRTPPPDGATSPP